ncbi:Ditrans,polycis-undecaprenyl-diphosphate synthase ((2E,6E)-farnesyl-diphosphate specific) [Mycobacterium basiliense]|uniref:Isoprenyl transferase n=1 Tax=Mycobacterium basiliense TaxID=2094119 RepID=A0A3S4BG18_9MYCO|nr:polyprenyl diphosphate synthase [Mycobacterium basiliense]VDM89822.1 Ditrans,polycis-undecaprenyl-diphosphate synthase ((2E,6E)-farnesyl-diphosphate specific) [Mycobacterium basiliense]
MHQLDHQQSGATAQQPPRCVAIYTDGNARWATRRGLSAMEGHLAGGKVALKRVRDACELGIEQLSLFTFSVDNMMRSAEEVATLMSIMAALFDQGIQLLGPWGVRLRVVGSRNGLPQDMSDAVDRAEAGTAHNSRMDLFFGLNYGGRQELLDAAQRYQGGGEEVFRRLLCAPEMRDLDLVIRTGGDRRLSNGFLWHAAYAELLFVDELWPDFTRERFENALAEYGRRAHGKD